MPDFTNWNKTVGFIGSTAEGVKNFAGLILTGTKAAFGNEGAQGQLKGVLDYISTPSNWPSLFGAMTPTEREQLAQAYERGDGQAVAIMMGEQATELPMFGGTIKKAGNVAKAVGKVDGAKPQNMADKIIIVDSKGNALIGDWSKTKVLTAPENALAHWQKHGSEFPEITSAAQYVDFAQDFVKNPPPNVLTKTRPNGDVMLYDQTTNTFAVRTASGVPKTIFKPNDGINYWRKQ